MLQAETGTPVTDLPLQLAGTAFPACLLYGGYTLTQTVFPQIVHTFTPNLIQSAPFYVCKPIPKASYRLYE